MGPGGRMKLIQLCCSVPDCTCKERSCLSIQQHQMGWTLLKLRTSLQCICLKSNLFKWVTFHCSSLSSYQATGYLKSPGLARPFAPIGPSSGSDKWCPKSSQIHPLESPSRSIENVMPLGITQIYLGLTVNLPIKVVTKSVPLCGTIKKSPSEL